MSIFDLPQDGLNPVIWDKKGQSYILRDRIKTFLDKRIYGRFEDNLCSPKEWVKDILLHGSAATNQYNPRSKIDLALIISPQDFKIANPYYSEIENQRVLKNLTKLLSSSFSSYSLPGMISHVSPEVFDEGFTFEGDGLYSIKQNRWLKDPLLVAWDFNPWESFRVEIEFCKLISRAIFPAISDARVLSELYLKTSKDYNKLVAAIKELCYIETLLDSFRARRRTENPYYPAYNHSKNWEYHNVIYKILESWGISHPVSYIANEYPFLKDVFMNIKSEFNFDSSYLERMIDVLEKQYRSKIR